MSESGYYPAGCENDPNAPWNLEETPEILVDCDTSMLLRNTLTVATTDYEVDDCGCKHIMAGHNDLESCVQEQCYTIPQMLDELAKYVKKELDNNDISWSRKQELKQMLNECQGWQQGDLSVDDFEIQR